MNNSGIPLGQFCLWDNHGTITEQWGLNWITRVGSSLIEVLDWLQAIILVGIYNTPWAYPVIDILHTAVSMRSWLFDTEH